MLNYNTIPVHYMVDGVRRYVEQGIPPGSFLLNLFSNDLKGAFGKADDENTAAMLHWVRWMYNEMPSITQGSPEKVRAWVTRGGMAGLEREERQARRG